MKKIFFFTTLMIFSMFALPIAAQDIQSETETWTLFFWDSVTNTLIRVDETGDERITLELGEGGYLSPGTAAINTTGEILGYCLFATPERNATLILLDLATQTEIVRQDMGILRECRVSAVTADWAVISYVDENSRWGVGLHSPVTGERQHVLTSEDDIAPAYNQFGEGVPMLAAVRTSDADSITFIGIPGVGMGIGGTLPAYTWNWQNGTVEEAPLFGNLGGDYLWTTGEFATATLDESRPAATPAGPIPAANTVVVTDADGNERTVYYTEDYVVGGVTFVDNGRAIVIRLVEGSEIADAGDVGKTRLLTLDRTGTLYDLGGNYDGYADTGAVPDGAFVIWAGQYTSEEQPPAHQLDIYRNGEVTQAWRYEAETGSPFTFLQPMWTPPLQATGEPLAPFPAL